MNLNKASGLFGLAKSIGKSPSISGIGGKAPMPTGTQFKKPVVSKLYSANRIKQPTTKVMGVSKPIVK